MISRKSTADSGPPVVGKAGAATGAANKVTVPRDPVDPPAGTLAGLAAAKRSAVRETLEAVAWLAGTVLDAAPALRPARYRDALDQARAAGIPTGDLPAAYVRELDPLLRRYRDEARTILERFGGAAG